MKLKIRYRSAEETNNSSNSITAPVLFARLPLRVVKILYEEAKKSAILEEASVSSSLVCWNIADSSSSMEFLPLQITRTNNNNNNNNNNPSQICYSSYNGGTLVDEDNDVIELHSCLQTWEEKQEDDDEEVDVIALPIIRNATRIRVDPLRLEDWELLECFAAKLEDGGILSQISIVYPNQIVPLTLSGTTSTARIRITPNEWFENEPCLRLVPETVVEIVPHPRNSSNSTTEWSVPLRVAPYFTDVDDLTQQLIQDLLVMPSPQPEEVLHSCSIWLQNFEHQQQQLASLTNVPQHLNLLPEIPELLWIHPNTLLPYIGRFQATRTNTNERECYRARIRRYRPDNNYTDDSINAIANVFMDTTIPLNHVAFSTLFRYKLGLTPLTSHVVQLQLLDTIDPVGNSSLQHHGCPSTVTNNDMFTNIKLPDEWNYCSLNEAWRFPSNAISALPDWVQQKCCSRNPHNNTPTIIVPLLDKVFHLVPTIYTSTIGMSTEIGRILSHYSMPDDFGAIRGVAICGEEGTGKTHLSLIVANLKRHLSFSATIYLDCKKLQSSNNNLASILKELSKVFQDAYEQAPSLIVLDDLDFLTPNVWNNDDKLASSLQQQQQQISPLLVHQAKVISDHLRFLWNEYCSGELDDDDTDNAKYRRIRILCTCKDKQSLHPSLRCCNKFDSFVSLPTRLEGKTRYNFLNHMLKQQHSISSQVVESQILESWLLQNRLEIEQYTDGYRPSDLYILSCRLIKSLNQVSAVDGTHHRLCWNQIVQDFIPLSLRYRMNHMSFIRSGQSIATKTWSDVGGLFKAKAILEECILRPIQFHKVYSNCPVLKLPRGVLLYGPSGCGKTWIVSALAHRCNLNFVTCKGPELLDKYIGASEAKVRQLFEQANAASPCLLFFDDFDALAPKRGSDNTGVTDRVVNQLLTFLDGVEVSGSSIQDRVFIVAATSRPDKVDSALLRPGRLDRHIYIGLPEADEERNDVFATIARNYPLDERAKHCIRVGLSSEGNLLQGSTKEKLAYFSPADLKAVLSTAYMEAINSQLEISDIDSGSREKEQMALPLIKTENLICALEETNPSMSSADYRLFQQMYKRFMRSDRNNPSSVDYNKLEDLDSSWDENGKKKVPKLETALK